MSKLSIVLATRNEEKNIGDCLRSVKKLADEIVVVDESSADKTKEIAESHGAKVYKVQHEPIFHITKQKALDFATGDWILQLDADERVMPALAHEIKRVINMSSKDIIQRRPKDSKKWKLFQRHQSLIEMRDGKIGKATGEVVAFFLPRLNYFLGKPLKHAGVYPDPAIRLVKKDKAHFPAKSVHEIMEVNGVVAWLFNDLEHRDSPTLARYFNRMNRYTDLQAMDFKNKHLSKDPLTFIYYITLKPLFVFLKLYVRHLGFLDGYRGFLWSLFSSWHYPVAYVKYIFA